MKEFNEDMFIVINKKRFQEIAFIDGYLNFHDDPVVQKFYTALCDLAKSYLLLTGFRMDQKYIVCNQDEPYAEQVKAIILGQPDPRDALIEQAREALSAISKYGFFISKGMGEKATKEEGELTKKIHKALAALEAMR